jgi:hypothetical protein
MTARDFKARMHMALLATATALTMGVAHPAYANVYDFNTPPGATAGGQPVDAHATFTTGAGTLTLTLTNLLANPKSIIQAISDIFFSVSGATGAGTGLYDPTASYITIAANGTSSAAAAPTHHAWDLTYGGGTFHLDKLCGKNTCGTPAGLIIGPGPYTNANGSIAGNKPHNPFVDQTATFTFLLAGVTANSVISNVVFSFGTETGTNVAVPIPAAVWLFASGLLALIGIARRRQAGLSRTTPLAA